MAPRAPEPRQLGLFADGIDGEPLRVLAHPDPHVLEAELLERVAAERAGSGVQPILIVTPTRLLADHVRRRLAERKPAWLGVEVLTLRALVFRILASGSADPPRLLSDRLLEAVLDRELQRLPRSPLRSFLQTRPGGRRALLASLQELREAGVPPAEVRSLATTPSDRALAEVYAAYARALEVLATRGLVDEPGLVAAATGDAESHAARYRATFVHGAYELVGMHVALLRSVHRGSPVTVLLPVQPGAPAGAYGERFARRSLVGEDGELTRLADRPGGLLGGRLGLLYDEAARTAPRGAVDVAFRHTQGAPAELSVALRHALRAVEDGVPPTEIALVARTLAPYAPALEDALGALAAPYVPGAARVPVPCLTTVTYPLRREPVVHDLLLLLRVLGEDFPRAPTVELLRSPRLRWELLLPDATPPRGDLAEPWSRRAGILGGLREWTEDLPAWAAGAPIHPEESTPEERERRERQAEWRRDEARRIADGLNALARLAGGTADRSWDEHAAHVERLAREVLPGDDAVVATRPMCAVFDLLDEMRDLAQLSSSGAGVPYGAMLDWIERAVDETELAAQEEDGGGIRVLDSMQARGLTFRRVFLLGLHGDVTPREPRADPFLDDAFRERLRERGGRPLPVKLEGVDEERLLLSMILGSARERLDVSWQRADDTGRSRTPSSALRELARVLYGRADPQRILDEAERLSSHPARRLAELARAPGLLTAVEEDVLLALRSPNPRSAMEAIVPRRPDLSFGLTMVEATESYAPDDLSYDGRIGPRATGRAAFTVTSLEHLGRCPLRFFFEKVLRVREMEEEATVYEIPLHELGTRVHRILEAVYRRLGDERLLDADNGDRATRRARALLEDAWAEHMQDVEERRRRRLSAFWSIVADRWKSALGEFMDRDLRRIVSEGWTVTELECSRRTVLDFGDGCEAEISGRFDRVLSRGDRVVVGDYKTIGRLKRPVNETEMLKGKFIQVPLYHMLAGADAEVHLLGVGPLYDLDSTDPNWPAEARFDGFRDRRGRYRDGFLETMRTLVRIERGGTYAMTPGESCRYCCHTLTCRRRHPPTLERDGRAPDAAGLLGVQRKSTRFPRLEDVTADLRRRRGPETPAEDDLEARLSQTLRQARARSEG